MNNEIGVCKKCLYWERNKKRDKVLNNEKFGLCRNPKLDYEIDDALILLGTWGGEYVFMETRENFGCICFSG